MGNGIPDQRDTPRRYHLPLLANIVLNELDQWVDSQWQDNPVTAKYKTSINANGSINKSNAYKFMRRTNLKEMYIVRYADDFRIFCRTKDEAERTMKQSHNG